MLAFSTSLRDLIAAVIVPACATLPYPGLQSSLGVPIYTLGAREHRLGSAFLRCVVCVPAQGPNQERPSPQP